MSNTRCAYDIVGECTMTDCKFAHKKNVAEWMAAPWVSKETASALIQLKNAKKKIEGGVEEAFEEKGR
jgi:hypothetical protein